MPATLTVAPAENGDVEISVSNDDGTTDKIKITYDYDRDEYECSDGTKSVSLEEIVGGKIDYFLADYYQQESCVKCRGFVIRRVMKKNKAGAYECPACAEVTS